MFSNDLEGKSFEVFFILRFAENFEFTRGFVNKIGILLLFTFTTVRPYYFYRCAGSSFTSREEAPKHGLFFFIREYLIVNGKNFRGFYVIISRSIVK